MTANVLLLIGRVEWASGTLQEAMMDWTITGEWKDSPEVEADSILNRARHVCSTSLEAMSSQIVSPDCGVV